MKSNKFLTLFLIIYTFNLCHAQIGTPPTTGYPNNPSQAVTNANFAWYRGGNNPGGPADNNNILGTRWASDIWIMTNNVNMARFTSSLALTTPWDFNGVFSGSGHGLSIQTSSTASGNLDLFTAQQGTTHIKFGGSGAISGQNSRMEYFAGERGFI